MHEHQRAEDDSRNPQDDRNPEDQVLKFLLEEHPVQVTEAEVVLALVGVSPGFAEGDAVQQALGDSSVAGWFTATASSSSRPAPPAASPRWERGRDDDPDRGHDVFRRQDDIALVVMTHLHVDHTSGMLELPRARFVCSTVEWAAATGSFACCCR